MSRTWPEVPLGEVLVQDREYVTTLEPREYPKLSVKLYGKGVTLDSRADATQLKMQRHQIAKAGQVILSEIWGKKGAIGFVPCEGDGALCTSHFFLFDLARDRVEPGWLAAIFRANYLAEQLGASAFGTTGYAAVRPKDLLAATIPLPPLPEQRRIVAKIEELTAKIEEATALRQEAAKTLDALLRSVFGALSAGADWVPMGEVAPLTRRPATIDPNDEYPELGIRSFGKGTFHKPPLNGMAVGTKRLYQMEPGDLVFNNVFAWEGAVAVAKPEDRGRFGSHRFITCVPRPEFVTAQFLRFFFDRNRPRQIAGCISRWCRSQPNTRPGFTCGYSGSSHTAAAAKVV